MALKKNADDLSLATWDCSLCNWLRCIVVWSQMPKTPHDRGVWLGKIMDHEQKTGHLVYPKAMLPWQDEKIVMVGQPGAPDEDRL